VPRIPLMNILWARAFCRKCNTAGRGLCTYRKIFMNCIVFLIAIPCVAAFFLLFLRCSILRGAIVFFTSFLVCCASIFLLVTQFNREISYFDFVLPGISSAMTVIKVALAAYIFFIGIKHKNFVISGLIALQVILFLSFEYTHGHALVVAHNLFIDKFSVIMVMIVGIIGSLIAVFSLGYMRDFHEQYHKEIKDNRGLFFFLIFVFLSAMFGIVCSNNLLWVYFFWEITTVCSFLLIRYKQTDESVRNALFALKMNLFGGVAFIAAIWLLYQSTGTIELDKLILHGGGIALLPVVLLGFAGLTKSAQMPFSSWLTGAMVAPTPVSALLHSSTMVNAGVYLILRFAGVFQVRLAGFMLGIIGGVTFLIASFIAITQSDAKKVLAYSTIANLGLVVLCGGIGTYEAVWAGILLIIFHAIAKGLLFLCVGIIEHKIHSRDIEDMSGLIITMPKISIMLQLGMAGMFLAPFGMLISKWAVLKALVDFNPVLAVFIVFGGTATLFFWVKWMGRLLIVSGEPRDLEKNISLTEWIPLSGLALLTLGICALFPVVSSTMIEPYVREIYGVSIAMSRGNIVIMSIMLGLVMLFPLSFINYGKNVKVVDAYLGGANATPGTSFFGPGGKMTAMETRNYYLTDYLNEKRLLEFGAVLCLVLIAFMFIVSYW